MLHDGGGIGVFTRQDVLRNIEQRDPRAEAGERLRELTADGTGTDDRH